MTSRIVAFDLNGTLTTEEGLDFYKRQKSRDDTTVGILTANLIVNAYQFTQEKNLDPEFVRRGLFKAPELKLIELSGGEEHIYVGNSVTDEVAANLAGWEYIDVDELN